MDLARSLSLAISLYMVTLPQQISEVYRNTAILSIDPFVRDSHKSFDLASISVSKMCEIPMAHGKNPDPRGRKNLLGCSVDFSTNAAEKSW